MKETCRVTGPEQMFSQKRLAYCLATAMRTGTSVRDGGLQSDEQGYDGGKSDGFPIIDTFHDLVSFTVSFGRFLVNRSDDHTIERPRTHSAPKQMVNC